MSKLNKHLTLSDRIYIEQELLQATSFKQIGLMLEKDPTIYAMLFPKEEACTNIPKKTLILWLVT